MKGERKEAEGGTGGDGERRAERRRTHGWKKEINGALCEGNKKQRQCEAVRDHHGF